MSSVAVREIIFDFLATVAPTENVVDLSGEFDELKELLDEYNVPVGSPWLGVQFVGSEEDPIDVRGTNNKGKYRELGVIYLHVVGIAHLRAHQLILPRGEALRNAFRGQRLEGKLLVEAVSPVNFGQGITLNFEGGYTAGAIEITYTFEFDL